MKRDTQLTWSYQNYNCILPKDSKVTLIENFDLPKVRIMTSVTCPKLVKKNKNIDLLKFYVKAQVKFQDWLGPHKSLENYSKSSQKGSLSLDMTYSQKL